MFFIVVFENIIHFELKFTIGRSHEKFSLCRLEILAICLTLVFPLAFTVLYEPYIHNEKPCFMK